MATRFEKLIFTVVSLLLWANGGQNKVLAQENVTIAGGSVAGVYTHAADTLCAVLNTAHPQKYACRGRSGLGSVFNVNAVKRDLVEFGLVQSDRNWQAWHGKGDWLDRPATSVRSVFALHDELVHIVAREDSDIKTVTQLKDKRVNIGNLSSGQRGNAITILQRYGIDAVRDLDSFSYQQGNAYHAYGDKTIDAFFYTVGVPSPSVTQVTKEVPSRFLPLDRARIEPLLKASPFYVFTEIPQGVYRGVTEPVPTLGVKATLMTSEKVPHDLVYDLTKSFFENLDTIKSSHPALAQLTVERAREGLSAPLHEGALKYYREQGWVD